MQMSCSEEPGVPAWAMRPHQRRLASRFSGAVLSFARMTAIRPRIVTAALSLACGSVGVAPSPSQSQSPPSRRMLDGKQWTTENLSVTTARSYCYDNVEQNCGRYGRLYTWELADGEKLRAFSVRCVKD